MSIPLWQQCNNNNNLLHLYSAFLGTQALYIIRGISPHPPAVRSIRLDDATAAILRQNGHHTPAYWWRGDSDEANQSMGMIRRPWWSEANGYFQQDNAPCHKAKIISDWFLEQDNEFTLLKWPPQSPDLNPIEHLWDVVEREIHIMDMQPIHLQQLHDAIMSIWNKISEECLQHLVESIPWRIKAVLNAKWGPTRY